MIRGDDARLSRYETSENRPARRTRPVYIREILPRFLRLRETGSLRRLSLDISSVPGIAAPPRGYLLANRTTRRVPSISQPRDFPPRPSRTSASAFIIYMIFARDQQNHRSNTRVDRRRKRWPFDTANPTVKPSAISTTLRFPFFFFLHNFYIRWSHARFRPVDDHTFSHLYRGDNGAVMYKSYVLSVANLSGIARGGFAVFASPFASVFGISLSLSPSLSFFHRRWRYRLECEPIIELVNYHKTRNVASNKPLPLRLISVLFIPELMPLHSEIPL